MTRVVEAAERAKIALSDKDEVRLFDPSSPARAARPSTSISRSPARTSRRSPARSCCEPSSTSTPRCATPASAPNTSRILLVGGVEQDAIWCGGWSPPTSAARCTWTSTPTAPWRSAPRSWAGASAARRSTRCWSTSRRTPSPSGWPNRAVLEGLEADDLARRPSSRGTRSCPSNATRTVFTLVPDQPAAELPIVQGEHPRLCGNTRLGTVRVEPLPPGPANAPVEVTFRLDLSGVLHVRRAAPALWAERRRAHRRQPLSAHRAAPSKRRRRGGGDPRWRTRGGGGPERGRPLAGTGDARARKTRARRGGRRRGEPGARARRDGRARAGGGRARPRAGRAERRAIGLAPAIGLAGLASDPPK